MNYASAIALDASGNIVVAGGTRSRDFPTSNATGGLFDSFAAVISADGSALN
jgi:hypothetical protein